MCPVKIINLELLSSCHWVSPSEETSVCSTCSAACQHKQRKVLIINSKSSVLLSGLFQWLLASVTLQLMLKTALLLVFWWVERWNIRLYHCQSLSGCQSSVGCWDVDFCFQDVGLELSGFDRCDVAASSSWSAAGSADVKSADRSTQCKRSRKGIKGAENYLDIYTTSYLVQQPTWKRSYLGCASHWLLPPLQIV